MASETARKKVHEWIGKPVLVTTSHRGVFFGYLASEPESSVVTLKKCRNCVYWSSDVRGFVGLTTTGPTASCKVGPACEQIQLRDVTSVALCGKSAAEAWEAAPWKS